MFKLITKPNCKYCTMAKNLLTNYKLPFSVVEIGKDITREEVLQEYPYIRTVPIIFKDDAMIGGYEQLVQLPEFQNATVGPGYES